MSVIIYIEVRVYMSKSEKNKSKKEKETKGLKLSNNKMFIIIAVVAVILLIFIYNITMSNKFDSSDIAYGLINGSSKIKIKDYPGDKKQIHGYTSRSIGYDSSIVKDGDKYKPTGYIVEVYNNSQDASFREEELKNVKEYCTKYFSVDDFGTKYSEQLINDTYDDLDIYTKQKIVLRISKRYSDKQKEKLIKKFNKYLKGISLVGTKALTKKQFAKIEEKKLKYDEQSIINIKKNKIKLWTKKLNSYITKLSNCKESEIAEIVKEIDNYNGIPVIKDKYDEAVKKANEAQSIFDAPRKAKADEINNTLNELLNSLDETKLTSVRNEIAGLKEKYYDQYKDSWNTTISTILAKIEANKETNFKNSCANYSYNDVLRNPENYNGKPAVWYGKVLQIIDKDTNETIMRVGVNCSYNSYATNNHICSDAIYVIYSGSTSLITDDMINMWGNMNGSHSYETVLHATMTIPAFKASYVQLLS